MKNHWNKDIILAFGQLKKKNSKSVHTSQIKSGFSVQEVNKLTL